MFDFEKILRNLVLENRRVIIPELGAFLLREGTDAKPSIIFSSFLRYNDGFLENSLCVLAGISAQEATQTVRDFVEKIISLSSSSKFEIKGLGHFCKDARGAIQFVFDPKDENEISAPLVQTLEDQSSSQSPNAPRKRNKWIYTIVATVLMVALFGFLYVFVVSKLQDTTAGSLPPIQTSSPVVEEAKETVPSTSSTQSSTDLNQGPIYHVIGGCFSDKINADRFVEKCRENGYKDVEILPKMGDLIPVSVMRFGSKQEAERKKTDYNEQYDEDAWVYRTY